MSEYVSQDAVDAFLRGELEFVLQLAEEVRREDEFEVLAFMEGLVDAAESHRDLQYLDYVLIVANRMVEKLEDPEIRQRLRSSFIDSILLEKNRLSQARASNPTYRSPGWG